ncbi:MAG TPA: cupin domain-containing protein [Myxococcaceae bacterium]|nr:cupin domain-containing protein [Myxococcaceae bacterium]
MRHSWNWMVLVSTTLFIGTGQATPAKGFTARTCTSGEFDSFDLFNHWSLTPTPGEDPHGRKHEPGVWFALLETRGKSDLYVQDNTWDPGGTTGWHTHPGPSLIIVTEGTVTDYEGGDPKCKPHVYKAGQTLFDPGGGHVHVIRNETAAPAKTVAIQLIPHAVARRVDVAAPGNCPF